MILARHQLEVVQPGKPRLVHILHIFRVNGIEITHHHRAQFRGLLRHRLDEICLLRIIRLHVEELLLAAQVMLHELVIAQPNHRQRRREIAGIMKHEPLHRPLNLARVSFFEYAAQARPIQILRQRLSALGIIMYRRQQIPLRHRHITLRPRLHSRPGHHERHTQAAFVKVGLAAAQGAIGPKTAAVVGRENDQGVVELTGLFQRRHNRAQTLVAFFQHSRILQAPRADHLALGHFINRQIIGVG